MQNFQKQNLDLSDQTPNNDLDDYDLLQLFRDANPEYERDFMCKYDWQWFNYFYEQWIRERDEFDDWKLKNYPNFNDEDDSELFDEFRWLPEICKTLEKEYELVFDYSEFNTDLDEWILEDHSEHFDQFKRNHKRRMKNNTYIKCEMCNCNIKFTSMTSHQKSQKHQKAIQLETLTN